MRLLLIDNYDSFTYNLYHGLAPYFEDIKVLRNDQINIDGAGAFDAIVISPGPGLPNEAGSTMSLLDVYLPLKPILGICLGHQAIVESLGGRLLNLDGVVHGKSRTTKVLDMMDPIYRGIGKEFDSGRYHSWVADPINIPSCLKVTARDEDGNVMSVRHCEYPVWGLQYHPESVLTDLGDVILQNWANEVKNIYP